MDLNRRWGSPTESLHPTVFHVKSLISDISKERQVILYCDLHGHSRKKNVFVYGCAPPFKSVSVNDFNKCRLLPYIMSQIGHGNNKYENISFRDCRFKVSRSKHGTARCVIWKDLGICNSLTVEASFCGSGDNASEKRQLREWKKSVRRRAKLNVSRDRDDKQGKDGNRDKNRGDMDGDRKKNLNVVNRDEENDSVSSTGPDLHHPHCSH